MKSKFNLFCLSCVLGVLLLTGCALPQRYWPQKDLTGPEVSSRPGESTVLIASRGSEYKRQLVGELQKQLSSAQISQTTIGIKQLEEVDLIGYAVIVIINTCIASGLDHDVRAFLDRQETTANIILLTTSGVGSWLPDKRGREFDAISGASDKENVGDVARDLLTRIQTKL